MTLQSMIKTIVAQVKALEKLISGRVAWSSCIVSNIGNEDSDGELGDEIYFSHWTDTV